MAMSGGVVSPIDDYAVTQSHGALRGILSFLILMLLLGVFAVALIAYLVVFVL